MRFPEKDFILDFILEKVIILEKLKHITMLCDYNYIDYMKLL